MAIAIITADLVNSRAQQPQLWMTHLKTILNSFGSTPKNWEIYRGDSFQLETEPQNALRTAIVIKAYLKYTANLDLRIAIGIGDKTYDSDAITSSNGTAFINSGTCFESLKKNLLAIKTVHVDLDNTLNLMFYLASFTFNNWTQTTAELIAYTLTHPNKNQKLLASHFETTQSNISQSLKRGGYDELKALIKYYESKLKAI
jgi:hypothetical protein